MICLIGAIITFIHTSSSATKNCLVLFATIGSLYFYVEAGMLVTENKLYVYHEMLSRVASLVFFPMILVYFIKMKGSKVTNLKLLTAFIPTVFMIMSSLMIIVSEEGLQSSNIDIQVMIYKFIIECYTAGIVIFIARTLVKSGTKARDLNIFQEDWEEYDRVKILGILLIILSLTCCAGDMAGKLVHTRNMLSCIYSIIVTTELFMVFYAGFPFLSKYGWSNIGLTGDKNLERDVRTAKAGKTEREHKSKDNLLDRFNEYMDERKAYLNNELSLEDVAKELNSNRTYISSLIKNSFNTSFRNYINTKRIEEAQKLMQERPQDMLSNIAADSGFTSDSQLIKKFNEIVGMSPRAWLKSLK